MDSLVGSSAAPTTDAVIAQQIQSSAPDNGAAEGSGHLFSMLSEFDNILADPLGMGEFGMGMPSNNGSQLLTGQEQGQEQVQAPIVKESVSMTQGERVKKERYSRPAAPTNNMNFMGTEISPEMLAQLAPAFANLVTPGQNQFSAQACNTQILQAQTAQPSTPTSSQPLPSAQEAPTSPAKTPTAEAGKSTKRKVNDPAESEEDRQARIRMRNREQARRCRQKKRQASEDLNRKVTALSHQNEVLKKAFSVLYTQKSLLESVVTAQFGQLGRILIESTKTMQQPDGATSTTPWRDMRTIHQSAAVPFVSAPHTLQQMATSEAAQSNAIPQAAAIAAPSTPALSDATHKG